MHMVEQHADAAQTAGFDRDIWLRAHKMLARHGDYAAVLACMMADSEFIQGRMGGYQAFKRVASAIEDLLKNRPGAGLDIH